MKKLWLFIVISFIAGFIWGQVFCVDLPQHYSNSKILLSKQNQKVTVDIVKEGDEILIYEYYSGKLVFEYNKNKEVDKSAYKEFEDTWEEVKSYR